MKCPYNSERDFSIWDEVCQNCHNFERCKKEELSSLQKDVGDNYPTYNDIHFKLLVNKKRSDMIEKLINENMPIINKEDILDWLIDCEIYNKECRKQYIKKVYKKRTKKKKK